MGFAEKIKQLRKAIGLSQEELGVALKVGKSTISMYETGIRTPTFERLEEIADFFNIDMNELMGRERDGSSSIGGSEETPLTDKQKRLVELAKTVPEEKVDLVYRVMKSIVEKDG